MAVSSPGSSSSSGASGVLLGESSSTFGSERPRSTLGGSLYGFPGSSGGGGGSGGLSGTLSSTVRVR